MGPKKKGTKKKVGKKTGAKKGKGPTIIDGVPVSEMSKDQLEGHVRRLQDEVCWKPKLLRIYIALHLALRTLQRGPTGFYAGN